jgi:uncharacterized protein (DUF305 family)
VTDTALATGPSHAALTGSGRRRGVRSWMLVVVGFGAAVVGLVAGPAMPWADDRPVSSSAEAGFARDMTLHHEQAVQMSLIAMERGSSAEVRQLAKDVVLTQTSQIGAMQGWLQLWGLSARDRSRPRMAWMGPDHSLLPDGRMPGMASTADVRALESLSGTAFDTRYLTLLHEHHVGGIPMAQAALDRSDDPAVEQLAVSIRDSQSAELKTLESMLQRLGAAPPASGGAQHGGGHSG